MYQRGNRGTEPTWLRCRVHNSCVKCARCKAFIDLANHSLSLFRKEPDTKYEIIPFETKMELLLKWCDKLDVQKGKITSKGFTRSESFRRIKRQKSIKIVAKTAKTDDFRGAGNFWTSPADSTQKTAPDRLIFSFVRPKNCFFSSMYRRSSYETP